MMGAVVLGLACWDRHRRGHAPVLAGGRLAPCRTRFRAQDHRRVSARAALIGDRARPIAASDLVVCSTLLPAFLWYAWAMHLLGSGEGSHASADNRSIWLGLLGPSALLKPETLKFVGWFLFVRAFTPLGAGLAMIGLAGADGESDRSEIIEPRTSGPRMATASG